MTLTIRQMVNRNLGLADKILSVPTTVASDLSVDEFLKYPDVLKQKLFATLRCFLLVSVEAVLLSFTSPNKILKIWWD